MSTYVYVDPVRRLQRLELAALLAARAHPPRCPRRTAAPMARGCRRATTRARRASRCIAAWSTSPPPWPATCRRVSFGAGASGRRRADLRAPAAAHDAGRQLGRADAAADTGRSARRACQGFCAPASCPDAAPPQLLPPAAYPNTPATSFATKFVHVSTNKVRAQPTCLQLPCSSLAACQVRAAVTVVLWTPEGRRLLTGSQIGEFTLWNGVRLRPASATPLAHVWLGRHVVQLRDHFASARHRHPGARVEPQRKLAHLGCAAAPLHPPSSSSLPCMHRRRRRCCKVLAAQHE